MTIRESLKDELHPHIQLADEAWVEFGILNPAYSVIFFTVSSGAGYGLLTLLGLAASSHGKASSPAFAYASIFIALGLITAGLLSSTAHLGKPERAWRAFSQWRSSWLSREGIAAILTYPLALAFGATWSGSIDAPALIAPLGLLTAAMCMVTVFCTAMIYASLKPIPAWNSPLTLPVYILFALATGAAILSLITVYFGTFQLGAGPPLTIFTAVLIAAATALKYFYWRWLKNRNPQYTMAEATGLGEGVRQWEVPHTSSNFIMKEMGFQVARNHEARLQLITFALFIVALLSIVASLALPWLTLITVVTALAAAWVERWLFFAQAEHVSALFYGKNAV